MEAIASFFLLLCSVSLLSVAQAQEGSESRDHGLAQETPTSISPSTYDFFHPNASHPNTTNPCIASDCAPLSLSSFSSSSAEEQATQMHESVRSAPQTKGNQVRAGGIIGIVFGFVLVVLSAVGVYYVVVTRRANINRTNTVQPYV